MPIFRMPVVLHANCLHANSPGTAQIFVHWPIMFANNSSIFDHAKEYDGWHGLYMCVSVYCALSPVFIWNSFSMISLVLYYSIIFSFIFFIIIFFLLRGSSQNFGIFFIIGPILLKFSHNM